MIRRFLGEDVGAASIEYGLIAALVAVVIVAGLGNVGVAVRDSFRTVGAVVESPQSAAAAAVTRSGSSSSETSSSSSTRDGTTRTGSESSSTSEAATTSDATRAPRR